MNPPAKSKMEGRFTDEISEDPNIKLATFPLMLSPVFAELAAV